MDLLNFNAVFMQVSDTFLRLDKVSVGNIMLCVVALLPLQIFFISGRSIGIPDDLHLRAVHANGCITLFLFLKVLVLINLVLHFNNS